MLIIMTGIEFAHQDLEKSRYDEDKVSITHAEQEIV